MLFSSNNVALMVSMTGTNTLSSNDNNYPLVLLPVGKSVGKSLDHTCKYKLKISPRVEILEYLYKKKCSLLVAVCFFITLEKVVRELTGGGGSYIIQ
jgi:hypothetical protein